MDKYNVVIVGGGFAGLSTAMNVCSKVDATVLITDKNEIGDPTKTSPFTFPDIAEKFGLSDAVLQRYTRFSYESPTGVSARFQYDFSPFVTIDYQKACHLLLHQAQRTGNLTVQEHEKALTFESNKALFRPSKHKLVTASSEIQYDVLVDASGSAFFAARQLGIPLPRLYSHAYGELLSNCDVEDPERMRIFAGRQYGNGGGWLYPLDEKTARFGFATVTPSTDHPEATTKANFTNALKNYQPYNKMLEKSRKIRCERGSIPIGPLRKFVSGNIMMVGDSAGQATPWYCEGVRPSLEAGELCAEAIIGAYKKNNFSTRVLNKYQELWDSRNKKIYMRAMKYGYNAWFRSQDEWDSAVKFVASLSPGQMADRIRYNRY
ncbi:MAG: NAD(P)/FAD-dependent oxidoreductase [Candidatus Bathyarchaeia archaeon]